MTARRRISLNGTWSYVPDQYTGGETRGYMQRVVNCACPGHNPADHDWDGVDTIPVPACWNMARTELRYYERQLWYYRRFARPRLRKGERAFLCFEGSYYRTRAWLNEKELGQHLGGFTPFEFDITPHLQARNELAVLVDAARAPERAPTTVTDWFTYGGLYRDVFIEIRPAAFIRDFFIRLDRTGRQLAALIQASAPGDATLEIPALGIRQTVRIPSSTLAATIRIPAPARLQRWSPDHPRLYPVTVRLGADVRTESIGFRTIAVRNGRILLNGQPVYLKGICVHEDHFARGRSLTDADRRDIFREARALGCNFLRLAHYPHSRRMAEMADRLGILLWEEVPVYWRILWENRQTFADAANQLRELILRDRNRASVILWSVANETPVDVPGRTPFLARLSRLARKLDPSRLTTAALFKERGDDGRIFVNDPLAAHLDAIGINQYHGWYGEDRPEKADIMARFVNDRHPDKPVIVSEFGGGARAGLRGRDKFTEDYQARLYRRQLAAMRACDSIQGLTPWILMDFRSPMRHNRHQRGFNRKGLVDADRHTRKLAFKVYRDFVPPAPRPLGNGSNQKICP